MCVAWLLRRYLVKMLERNNVELLILTATFLKKLSIVKEHKDKMVKCVEEVAAERGNMLDRLNSCCMLQELVMRQKCCRL